ncbi:MAG: hypothetical protein WAP57_10710 [Aquabacterium commune]|uniref:hypothetical protein n=1 Tax=Aquabacterium TaxID=92793 RepID=UPI001D8407D1|nr:hypothetical protein [Aquabacterium sp.]MBT9609038.1 hypothetical protein [Aquabacterium sp.]
MFDYFDLKDALKSHFNYLTPGEAPYYFIIIGLEIFLFKAAHELDGKVWLWATVAGSLLMSACVIAALAQKWDNDKATERSQVRVGRIVGIAVPLIAIAVNMSKTKHTPALMLGAIALTFIQASAFLLLVRERPLERDKSINIPQLLVICSSLMFSIHFTLSSMSGRLFLTQLPDEIVASSGEKMVKVSEAASAAEKYDRDTEEVKRHDNDVAYKRNKIAQSILDEEAGVPLIPVNSIAADLQLGGKGVAISQLAVDSAKKQLANLRVLSAFLIAVWALVLTRTLYYAATKQ